MRFVLAAALLLSGAAQGLEAGDLLTVGANIQVIDPDTKAVKDQSSLPALANQVAVDSGGAVVIVVTEGLRIELVKFTAGIDPATAVSLGLMA